MENPLVSVIVPIRRGEDISKLASTIKNSSYKNTELIVVDEGFERSRQRNIGINRARGKYFLILDSDQYVSPCLIEECVELIQAGYGGIYIPEEITTPGWFGRLRNWERQFYTSTAIDCVRFVRNFCPLFDESMNGPEDSDWDRRIIGLKGTCLIRSESEGGDFRNNCLYHDDGVTIKSYFAKKAYYSKSMKRFAERNPGDQILSFWWRCFGVFLEKGKWRRFLLRPHLAIAVLMLIAARGVVYLCKR